MSLSRPEVSYVNIRTHLNCCMSGCFNAVGVSELYKAQRVMCLRTCPFAEWLVAFEDRVKITTVKFK